MIKNFKCGFCHLLCEKNPNFNDFSTTLFYARNAQVSFAEEPQAKINSLKKQKHEYLIQNWSDKD